MLLLLNLISEALQKDITLSQNIGIIEADLLQLRVHEKTSSPIKNDKVSTYFYKR